MLISNKKLFVLFAFVFSSFLISLFPSFNLSYAQNANGQLEYVPLTPLPGTTCQGSNCPTGSTPGTATLQSYIPGMFMLIILAVAVLAVARIVYGGILYITTDAIQGKSNGKAMIVESIWGLVLISISWLILYTISPRLVDVTFDIKPSAITDRFAEASSGDSRSVSCPTCTPLTGVSFANSNNQLSANTAGSISKLDQSLDGAGVGWVVTEAYPPTTQAHKHPCHYNGTCIDAQLYNATPKNINFFIKNAEANGLGAVYEVKTDDQKKKLVEGGVPETKVIVVPHIIDKSGKGHFSVYDCAANPGTCQKYYVNP